MATFEPKITRIESPTSVQSKIKSGRELAKQGRAEEALAEFEPHSSWIQIPSWPDLARAR
jgi:hypothetical protein